MTISTSIAEVNYATVLSAIWADAKPLNFVNGAWSETADRRPVVDPSTGVAFTSSPNSSKAEVEVAIAAAETAQPEWAKLTVAERMMHLDSFRAALEENAESLALLESVDSGNPMYSTRRDVGLALKYLREWPGQAIAQSGRVHKSFQDGISIVTHEPYGVVGTIIAYNHPSLFAIAGFIYPLLAGNTIVIKAASQTSLATLALGHIVGSHFPKGVINLIAGGREAGDTLVVDPRVKRLAFTGSENTALAIQSRISASGLVKHFTAELGGKNSFIIFPDTDLKSAIAAAFAGLSLNVSAGQSCQATARILVHQDIAREVEEGLAEMFRALVVGRSYDEETDMGPLVSEEQLESVDSIVRSGIEEGARLVLGGGRLDREGSYYAPTLFADATSEMRISRDEIFGPVAVIQQFESEDEAIRLANEVEHGLSAAVWTNNIDRALRVAASVQAGYIWVNDANRHYAGAPFGGMKSSGVGREESIEEFFTYTEPKAVNIKIRAK